MALEIEGKIISKLTVQSGQTARGQWAKQDFVIEYLDGQFSEKSCLQVWGQDKIAELEKYQVGDKIKAYFKPVSREFNGRWYTDLRVWKIMDAANAEAPANTQQASVPVPPPPTSEDLPGEDGDKDLPF